MMMLEQKMMELMGVQQGGMPDFEQFMWSLESKYKNKLIVQETIIIYNLYIGY